MLVGKKPVAEVAMFRGMAEREGTRGGKGLFTERLEGGSRRGNSRGESSSSRESSIYNNGYQNIDEEREVKVSNPLDFLSQTKTERNQHGLNWESERWMGMQRLFSGREGCGKRELQRGGSSQPRMGGKQKKKSKQTQKRAAGSQEIPR